MKKAANHFTANEIKPTGWLKRQLEIQAKGLSGNLDKMWPNVRDSAWIGGSADSWEVVPYWLDGFIPLAYLLDDEDMKCRAKRYIDAIIDRQQEDGWICPCNLENCATYDVWAVFLISKVLVLYYECSGDERIPDVLSRVLKNLQQHLRQYTLFNWAQSRWFEGLVAVYWLYERTKENWLLELATTLASQGTDYRRLLQNWCDGEPQRRWSYQTHIVNATMALKSEAMYSLFTGEDAGGFADDYYQTLLKYHGSGIGHIQGDECFAGTKPTHGTELCSIVEAMYSFEWLFEITGECKWLDYAEQLAFNSLPATISEDMWTHQYLQQVNQIACARLNEPSYFYTNNTEANMFGLEPHYICCTANFNQGWPKLALSAFYRTEKGIVSSILVPCKLNCEINGLPVSIELKTEYPFKSRLSYIVETKAPVELELGIRIPDFVTQARIDGTAVKSGEIAYICKKFDGSTVIEVELDAGFELCERPSGGFILRRGPLFYSIPIEEERKMEEYIKDGTERKFPYCDYQLFPKSEWRYAFTDNDFEIYEHGVTEVPFSRSSPPITVTAKLAKIDWEVLPEQPYICEDVPSNPSAKSVERVVLQPYGCTNLRITEMPFIKR